MQNPINYTQGSELNPLNVHVWSEADGIAMSKFREGLKTGELSQFSAIQGEDLGHRYVEDILGYESVLVDDQKGIRQGHDGVYYDAKNQEIVVVEYKGQNAQTSDLQNNPKWSLKVCEDIQSGRVPYQNASVQEQNVADAVLRNYEKGNRVRFEVVKTKAEDGKLISQLQQRTYLEMGMDSKLEGIKALTVRNLTQQILNRRGWAKGAGVKTFEGRDYTLTKNGNVLTVEAKDGRGVLLKLDGGDLTVNNLSQADMAKFEVVGQSLQVGHIQELPSMGMGK